MVVVAGGNGGGTRWRFIVLDFPLFDDYQTDILILRAERYFSFYRLIKEKSEVAVVVLEGDELSWLHCSTIYC